MWSLDLFAQLILVSHHQVIPQAEKIIRQTAHVVSIMKPTTDWYHTSYLISAKLRHTNTDMVSPRACGVRFFQNDTRPDQVYSHARDMMQVLNFVFHEDVYLLRIVRNHHNSYSRWPLLTLNDPKWPIWYHSIHVILYQVLQISLFYTRSVIMRKNYMQTSAIPRCQWGFILIIFSFIRVGYVFWVDYPFKFAFRLLLQISKPKGTLHFEF